MEIYGLLKEDIKAEDQSLETLTLTFNKEEAQNIFEEEKNNLKTSQNLIFAVFELGDTEIRHAFGITDNECQLPTT